jgi:putative ABC transport system permease protein
MSMSVQNLSVIAVRALKRNLMRTVLTCLGIIIGIFAVILLTGISNSLKIAVAEKVQSFGTNVIMMMAVKKPFTENDLKDIRKSIPDVQYITPMNSWEFPVKYKNKNLNRKIYAISNEYFQMGCWELESGSFFTKEDITSYDRVAIIGKSIQEKLFEYEDPIGKIILINRIPFRVVGLLKEKGMSLTGTDFDDFIAGPYSTVAKKLFGTSNFYLINIATFSESQVEDVKRELLNLLQKKYNLTNEQLQDYKVASSKEAVKRAEEITTLIAISTIGIAFISLVVGGIGIMNIMLASVSERTHEIGIRMAIGAKTGDILNQFLIEALVISALGGFVGITLGIVCYLLYTIIASQPFVLSMASVVVSFTISALVGIFFGYFPARKASRLNPIDALRYE